MKGNGFVNCSVGLVPVEKVAAAASGNLETVAGNENAEAGRQSNCPRA